MSRVQPLSAHHDVHSHQSFLLHVVQGELNALGASQWFQRRGSGLSGPCVSVMIPFESQREDARADALLVRRLAPVRDTKYPIARVVADQN